jgi:hypothetical protein
MSKICYSLSPFPSYALIVKPFLHILSSPPHHIEGGRERDGEWDRDGMREKEIEIESLEICVKAILKVGIRERRRERG